MARIEWWRVRNAVQGFGIARSVGVLAIVVLVGALVWSRWQLNRQKGAYETLALEKSNAIAERDVSRKAVLSAANAVKILGDSLQALERLGVQRGTDGVRRDDFDRATGRTSVVRGGISVTPGEILTRTVSRPTTDSLDVRIAVFRVDSSGARAGPRYVADARVEMPRPPAAASLNLGVRLLPIALSPRIQCGEAVNGIRPATMAVIAPVGVAVEVQPLELNARVCNEDFGRPRGWRIPIGWAGGLAAVAFVAGAVVAR